MASDGGSNKKRKFKFAFNGDLKRIAVDPVEMSFQQLQALVCSEFSIDPTRVKMCTLDEDSDMILLSNQREFDDIFYYDLDRPTKVIVTELEQAARDGGTTHHPAPPCPAAEAAHGAQAWPQPQPHLARCREDAPPATPSQQVEEVPVKSEEDRKRELYAKLREERKKIVQRKKEGLPRVEPVVPWQKGAHGPPGAAEWVAMHGAVVGGEAAGGPAPGPQAMGDEGEIEASEFLKVAIAAAGRGASKAPVDASPGAAGGTISGAGSSGFFGVYKLKSGRWQASIGLAGRDLTLGTYGELHEAAHVRDIALRLVETCGRAHKCRSYRYNMPEEVVKLTLEEVQATLPRLAHNAPAATIARLYQDCLSDTRDEDGKGPEDAAGGGTEAAPIAADVAGAPTAAPHSAPTEPPPASSDGDGGTEASGMPPEMVVAPGVTSEQPDGGGQPSEQHEAPQSTEDPSPSSAILTTAEQQSTLCKDATPSHNQSQAEAARRETDQPTATLEAQQEHSPQPPQNGEQSHHPQHSTQKEEEQVHPSPEQTQAPKHDSKSPTAASSTAYIAASPASGAPSERKDRKQKDKKALCVKCQSRPAACNWRACQQSSGCMCRSCCIAMGGCNGAGGTHRLGSSPAASPTAAPGNGQMPPKELAGAILDLASSDPKPASADKPGKPSASGKIVDDVFCEICGKGDREPQLLMCGDEGGHRGCNRGFHIFCLDPPLLQVPKDDWYCPTCQKCLAVD